MLPTCAAGCPRSRAVFEGVIPRFALVATLLALVAPRPAPAATAGWSPERALAFAAAVAQVQPAAPRPLASPERAVRVLGIGGLPSALTAQQRQALDRLLVAVAASVEVRRVVFAPFASRIDDVVRDPALGPSLLAGLDRGALLAAQASLVEAVRATAPTLATITLAEPMCTDGNVVCIGTDGDDTWSDDAQILIDPAGNDTYLNNAGGALQASVLAATGGCVLGGGSTGAARPNLACSPAPSNVCTYDTLNHATGREDLPVVGVPGHDDPETDNGSNGSCGNDTRQQRVIAGAQGLQDDPDARAVTLLVDLGGSDTYAQPWSHDDPLFNLIEDCYPGETDKVNTNRDFIQGGALAGLALTWDSGGGTNLWRGRLNAQGSGHVGGIGMLVVDGTSDNTFWADRLSQGNGIAAGIGILANTASGDQRYLLDPPVVYRNEFAPNARDCQQEGRAGQAEGGFGGVGIVVTAGGARSVYRAVTHATTNAYPYAAILDGSGAPVLTRGTDAQGSGESFPISATAGGVVVGGGLLIDVTDGDDRVCAGAGMLSGSTTATGVSLASMGVIDATCGKFNMPTEITTDVSEALQRVTAGALGVRVVLP